MKKSFFFRLFRPVFSSAQRQLDARIRQAVDGWVERKGYRKPLPGVWEIAEDIGIPSDQLNVYLHLHFGKTLLGWRKDLRIDEAKRLLLDYPTLPISTVGELVGIEDKSNFRKQFRETVGMAPGEWRRRHGC